MQANLLEGAIWHDFRASELVKQALTHPSCALKQGDVAYNNQRLEFLGDAVLGLVVAEMLYRLYPDEQEGELARRLSGLVCGERLVEIARSIGLGEALILSQSEEENDGRNNPSNLEDACEALIGAIYLDSGFDAARQFIEQHWSELAQSVAQAPKDPKTRLQEWAQGQGKPLPVYRLIDETGPSHAPSFTIEVSLPGFRAVSATASSKKMAERLAAEQLLEQIP